MASYAEEHSIRDDALPSAAATPLSLVDLLQSLVAGGRNIPQGNQQQETSQASRSTPPAASSDERPNAEADGVEQEIGSTTSETTGTGRENVLNASGPTAPLPIALPPQTAQLMEQMLAVQPASMEDIISQIMAADSGRMGPPPAAKLAVKELDQGVVDHRILRKHRECAVCQEELKSGQDIRTMPCKHVFHDDCLLEWLDRHNTCPMCRCELDTLDPEYEEHRRSRAARDDDPGPRRRPASDSMYM